MMLHRIGNWLYRILLLAFPRDLRRGFGTDMEQVFRAQRAETQGRPVAVLALWVRAIHDILVHAAAERASRIVARTHAEPIGRAVGNPRARGNFMETLAQDIRYAFRALARQPGFTTVVAVTLALGIGATTALFSVVNGVLLRELPYDSPDRIVRLLGTEHGVIDGAGTIAYLDFIDVREQATVFEAGAAYDEWRPSLTGIDEPEQIDGALVSSSFFDVLGVRPHLGRFFLPAEDIDGNDRVVVLGHGLWQRKFGADPGIIGTTLSFNGSPHVVVGIGPAGFEDPLLSGVRWGVPQVWRPLGLDGLSDDDMPSRGSHSYTGIARLKNDVTLERAAAEVEQISRRLEDLYPDSNTGEGMTPVQLHQTIVGDVRTALLVLLGAVGLVLAIAAINVGNLVLGRALDREREIAVRSALGASRGRLLRQLLTESLVLALLGGAAGVAVALFVTDAIVTLGASGIPRAAQIGLRPGVLEFAALITLVTGLASGLAPAIQLRARDLRASLAAGSRSATSQRAPLRLRSALVVSEVTITFVLLIGAGLLIESFWKLTSVETGLDTRNVLTFEIAPPSARYPEESDLALLFDDLLSRIRSIAGIRAAGAVNIAPLSGGFDCNGTRPDDRPPPPPGEEMCAEVRTITGDYYGVMGIELLRGREFTELDNADATRVIAINEALAGVYWPGESPLGKRLIFWGDRPAEVVALVKNVSHLSLDEQPPPRVYAPRLQSLIPWQLRRAAVVVKTDGDPASFVPTIRSEVWAIDSDLPLANVKSMEQLVSQSVASPRFRTFLLGAFAALAIVLASVGIYGVISYSVTQRTREMAIRLALGAHPVKLLSFVVGRGLRPVLLGMVFGAAGALATTRLLGSLLFGVEPTDPVSFVAVPLLMLGVASVAALLPARRAAAIDPMGTLRQE
jgi:putative ABC transport system permease protein